MIFLFICVVLTTSFFVSFKLFEHFKLNTFQAIVFNYITCVVVGASFSIDVQADAFLNDLSWMPYGIILGTLFISSFFLMAKTAQEVSITVSTVASKISMIVPSIVSLFLFKELRVGFSFANALGFVFSISALLLITHKKNTSNIKIKSSSWLLVLAVFLGTGVVDTIINLAGKAFTFTDFNKGFPVFCFGVAALIGFIIFMIDTKNKFHFKNVLGGICLGIPNYFSIYALMQGLKQFDGNAAFVYPIVHILSILSASLVAYLWFKEKLTTTNYVGVFFAIVAVVLLAL